MEKETEKETERETERETEKEADKIPENFSKIVSDFLNDLETTYPEIKEEVEKVRKDLTKDQKIIFDYCKEVYPERFFDILYQNEEIFVDDKKNKNFLPNIDFKNLWTDDISEKTKEIIWKYLQLILFTVVSDVDSTKFFGETEKLFEAIDEDSLKKKLQETIEGMTNLFSDISGNNMNFEEYQKNMESDLPDAEELHEHLSGLMGGKLGSLANEIAQETAKELDLNLEKDGDMNDIFQKLFKNPGKLINMVKKVGNKIEEKIKSGEIKESELMEEAQDLMKKMKNMPGMKNFQDIFGKMGMPQNGKMNMGQMNSMMSNNIKKAKQRERMLEKLKKRREQKKYTHSVFKDDSVLEKSSTVNNKKKKKKKKKKRRKDKAKKEKVVNE